MDIRELVTPALAVDAGALVANLETMSHALPGDRLRPHVKAHKCTALARLQQHAGHGRFACATIREMEGMVDAGLGGDLLLANEVLDASRLGRLVDRGAGITVAVDSEETIDAALRGGVTRVLVDLDVGMPRCGCRPEDAPRLADRARSRGLEVRGVMGYEGHVVGLTDRAARASGVADSMAKLIEAHSKTGGEIVSGGGTGTYDLNTWVNETQAGSYALMDTAYAALDLPFRQALSIVATVISSSAAWAVCDAGLKSLGMDHGDPTIEGHDVWFCSDEHITFSPPEPVGTRLRVIPAHVDPTVAYHEVLHVTDGDEVVDRWSIDLRGW